jgi:hypothetical protein
VGSVRTDGKVLFRGSFEGGGISPWEMQCANLTSESLDVTRGTLTVESRVVGQGARSARIDLPASPRSTSACEVLTQRPIGIGQSDYYGIMLRLPRHWRQPSTAGWGLVVAQLGYQGIWGAPVSLNVHADRVRLVLQSGLCEPVGSAHPHCEYQTGFGRKGVGRNLPNLLAIPPRRFATGVWHELVVHVHRAFDSTGVLEAWHRRKGQREWVKTAELRGYPTVQWSAAVPPERVSVSGPVDKIGAYRGPGAHRLLTIWQDGFVRATSFEAAAGALP